MAVNYRVVVMFASVSSAILLAFAFVWTLSAITRYRAKDFFTASDVEDFGDFGTCVEGLTEVQLKLENYDDPDVECRPDR